MFVPTVSSFSELFLALRTTLKGPQTFTKSNQTNLQKLT